MRPFLGVRLWPVVELGLGEWRCWGSLGGGGGWARLRRVGRISESAALRWAWRRRGREPTWRRDRAGWKPSSTLDRRSDAELQGFTVCKGQSLKEIGRV